MAILNQISQSTLLNGTSGTKVTTTANTSGTNSTEQTLEKTEADKAKELQTQFMKILLTQMKNQNPLDPMDTTEFTGQLVQYSSLEQQINTNTKLDTMLQAVQASSAASAFGYIGQEADLNTNMTAFQNDLADWNYTLGSSAKTVKVQVTDEKGKVLYEKDAGSQNAGTYELKLNAADFTTPPTDGQALYLKVTAKTASDTAVDTQMQTKVLIDGLENTSEGIFMRAGKLSFEISDILKLTKPTTTTTTTTTTNTGNSGA